MIVGNALGIAAALFLVKVIMPMLNTLKAKIAFGCLRAITVTSGIGLNSRCVEDHLIADPQATNSIAVALPNHND